MIIHIIFNDGSMFTIDENRYGHFRIEDSKVCVRREDGNEESFSFGSIKRIVIMRESLLEGGLHYDAGQTDG